MLNIQDSAKEAEQMIRKARKLGLYACIDLMYNLPGQTLEVFRKDVEKAIELDAEGVDCYLLEVYPGTPLAKQIQSGKVPPQGSSDLARKMYLEAYDLFEKAGYKPNGHSRFSRVVEHFNERCVMGWPWSGILTTGAGCFMGYLGKYSYENVAPASAYIDMVNRNLFPIARLSVSSKEDDMKKAMMRLYIRQPVNKQRFRTLYGKSPEEVFPDKIKKLKDNGLIEVDDKEIRLTKKGDVWRYNIAWEFGPQEKV
jgi:oxygen-independent coproporphyrinogen-3 oxidase